MRNKIKYIFKPFLAILLLSMVLSACEKAAKDEPWGYSLLYMPQAIVQSGGANNNFHVDVSPSENQDTTIIVGLYRSGLAELEEVTVDLSIDTDTLNFLLEQGQNPDANIKYQVYKDAKTLESQFYEIPSQLFLTSDRRDNYDFIKIHKAILLDENVPNGTKYILPLRISNPSKFELNNKLSVTIYILEIKK